MPKGRRSDTTVRSATRQPLVGATGWPIGTKPSVAHTTGVVFVPSSPMIRRPSTRRLIGGPGDGSDEATHLARPRRSERYDRIHLGILADPTPCPKVDVRRPPLHGTVARGAHASSRHSRTACWTCASSTMSARWLSASHKATVARWLMTRGKPRDWAARAVSAEGVNSVRSTPA